MIRYTREQWEEAHDLYVHDGMTYAEVAEATGVSVTALQRKGSQQQWMAERKQARDAAEEYRDTIFQLKLRAAKAALKDDVDPQTIHALTALERSFPEFRYRRDKDDISPRDKRELVVETIEHLVGYLQTAAPSLLYKLQDHLRPLTSHVFDSMGVAE